MRVYVLLDDDELAGVFLDLETARDCRDRGLAESYWLHPGRLLIFEAELRYGQTTPSGAVGSVRLVE